MTILWGEHRSVTVSEQSGTVRVTIPGKAKEWVAIRLLDASGNACEFFDDGRVTVLEASIPPGQKSVCIDLVKPRPGDYIFEVCTRKALHRLRYRAA